MLTFNTLANIVGHDRSSDGFRDVLKFDGQTLSTERDASPTPFTSWHLESQHNEQGVRLRTAVDWEHSARYLTVEADGSVSVKEDLDGQNWERQVWTRTFGDRISFEHKERQYLVVTDQGGVAAVGPNDDFLRHDRWRIGDGYVDKSQFRHGNGQGGWARCIQCAGLHWSGEAGVCVAGMHKGLPHIAGPERFVLPMSNPFALGLHTYQKCGKCSLLFQWQRGSIRKKWSQYEGIIEYFFDEAMQTTSGRCFDGQPHAYSENAPGYTLAQFKTDVKHVDPKTETLVDGYRTCGDCAAVFRSQGAALCPATGKPHQAIAGHWLKEWVGPSAIQRTFLPETSAPFPDYTSPELANQPRQAELSRAFEGYLAAIPADDLNQVNQNGGLRESYPHLSAATLGTLEAIFLDASKSPPGGQDASAWTEVGGQLVRETSSAKNVKDFYGVLETLFTEIFLDESMATNEVQKVIDGVLQPQPGPNWFDFAFGIAEALLGVVPALGAVGKGLGHLAEVVKAVVEVTQESVKLGLEASEGDMEGEDPLTTIEAKQWKDLRKRFDQQLDELRQSKAQVLSDWGRLQAIQAANLEIDDAEIQKQVRDSWVTAYRIRLYQQLMPLKFYMVYAPYVVSDDVDRMLKEAEKTTHKNVVRRYGGVLQATLIRDGLWDWTTRPGGRDSFPPAELMSSLLEETESGSDPINVDAFWDGAGGWHRFEVAVGGCTKKGPGTGIGYPIVVQTTKIDKL